MRRMVDTLAATADDHLERLPDLADAELERLRTTYHEALREDLPEGGDGSCTVIDRFALNIVHAGEIHRAFPHARFILVLRHPADCVLSCYMQTFYETSANASFHALEDAAYLYDQLFGLWRQYTDVLDLEYVTVKYEALVEDPEAACGPLLSFIGRPWHPDLLRYQATARERAQIRTASYDQVTRALYTHARERWRRYRRALEPVLPTLAPWIEHFGYDL